MVDLEGKNQIFLNFNDLSHIYRRRWQQTNRYARRGVEEGEYKGYKLHQALGE